MTGEPGQIGICQLSCVRLFRGWTSWCFPSALAQAEYMLPAGGSWQSQAQDNLVRGHEWEHDFFYGPCLCSSDPFVCHILFLTSYLCFSKIMAHQDLTYTLTKTIYFEIVIIKSHALLRNNTEIPYFTHFSPTAVSLDYIVNNHFFPFIPQIPDLPQPASIHLIILVACSTK